MEKKADLTNLTHYKCLESVEKSGHDLYLCYCGYQDCVPGHAFGPTVRNDYLVHIIISGKGTYTVGDKSYNLASGNIFLIAPGVTTYYKADEDDPWTYVWFGFNGLKAEKALRYAGLSMDTPVAKVTDVKPYADNVNGILEACKLTFSNEFKREAYLYALVARLGEDLHDENNTSMEFSYSYQTYVDYTINYIEHNYSKNIKITDIANYIGINRSYLTSCFKKSMNISPQRFLLEYRMKKAENLLLSTTKSINEISFEVGYEDSLAFSKVFKSYSGLSPKSYRANSGQ